uniref:Integrase core domain-containing protein n=1 Tax=Candidatus Kentrum eta TaxID=2126337 RepID=A0A450VH15_9GAMM|nr:MAG: Integrase core domain-containing protein [Candidatus Kentron sp. H]VFK04106.1 MAG: Integrase core domain-containing protein [Candidatus Kentron sp. H]VFK06516.1 MAG: Integrase core domain-containing protein [Candidatus Kentron sp. H]
MAGILVYTDEYDIYNRLSESGEIETEHPGYLGSQDTFYVGTLKGVRRIYQQTLVDTYSKVAFAKLYTTKTPITAADLLNDRVLPFFESHGLPMLRILTDCGTEYCGKAEQHDYQLRTYARTNLIEGFLSCRERYSSSRPCFKPVEVRVSFES